MNFMQSVELVMEHSPIFVNGIWVTIHLTFVSLVMGLLIAVPSSLILSYHIPYAQKIVGAYVYIFRGSPLIVQLFLIYHGLAQFEWLRESFLWYFIREPYWCALIAFSLNTGAYTTIILKGYIETTPKGELEAARAYGMSSWLQIKRIVLPLTLRRSLPAYSNEIIFTLHGSALASTVQMMDILGAGRWLNSRYYITFEGFFTAGVLYAGLTLVILLGVRLLERHWNKYLKISYL